MEGWSQVRDRTVVSPLVMLLAVASALDFVE